MSTIRKLARAALAIALASPTSALAQRAGQITFYSQANFRGYTYVVTGTREYVKVPFVVRSARVARGEAWQICPQASYRGNCNIINQDQGNAAWTVNSARPAHATTLPAPIAGREQSLRGLSAEFFFNPVDRSGRILSCPSGAAACAVQAADRFCQSRGWVASYYNRQETVAGRIYFADILCTRSR